MMMNHEILLVDVSASLLVYYDLKLLNSMTASWAAWSQTLSLLKLKNVLQLHKSKETGIPDNWQFTAKATFFVFHTNLKDDSMHDRHFIEVEWSVLEISSEVGL